MGKILSPNRPDYIFTYWILIWFILYVVKIVTYNPKYLFLTGAFLGVIQLGMMFAYRKSYDYILSFIMSITLTKGIPIYYLHGDKTTRVDIYVMLSLVVMYFCWLLYNGVSLRRFVLEYISPDKIFPVTNYIHQIFFRGIHPPYPLLK